MAQKANKTKPAINPEAREKQLINLAMDIAEQQMRDGTASPSVVTHFLKLGSTQASQDAEVKAAQAILAKSKAEQIKAHESNKATAEEAIAAMKSYKIKE